MQREYIDCFPIFDYFHNIRIEEKVLYYASKGNYRTAYLNVFT